MYIADWNQLINAQEELQPAPSLSSEGDHLLTQIHISAVLWWLKSEFDALCIFSDHFQRHTSVDTSSQFHIVQ